MKLTFPLLAALSAIAVTSCGIGRYKCRSRQSEAKATLKTIKSEESTYFAANKKYTASMVDLGVLPTARYYSIELSITDGGKGYKAIAKGSKPETTGDEWSMDESGKLSVITDKCE